MVKKIDFFYTYIQVETFLDFQEYRYESTSLRS